MSALFFVCPTTGREVSTGLELDQTSYKSLPNGATRISCPECGEAHEFSEVQRRLSGERDSQTDVEGPMS